LPIFNIPKILHPPVEPNILLGGAMRLFQLAAIAVGVTCVSACSGLTQMQDTINKFDQGAHTASTAQMSLFKQVQQAECNRNFYNTALSFAAAKKNSSADKSPAITLDLTAPCKHTELTDDQLQIRQKLMDSITLYADAIQTLANGTDDTNLSKNSQALATDINTLAKQQKFSAVTPATTGALNTALVTITNMILDHAKYKDIKSAASSVQQELSTVVEELKAENVNDIQSLESKAGAISGDFNTAVLAARENAGLASFLDVVYARSSIQSIVSAPPNVAQLNATLDALVTSNQALARATNGGAIPEISDLTSRAQQAVTLFNSSK
jgi:hypothetical protein